MVKFSELRSKAQGYSFAFLLVIAAASLRFVLEPMIGTIAPLQFFTVAQVAAAFLGGRGPGLLSVLLGTVFGYILFMKPGGRLHGSELVSYLIINSLVSIALVWMADAMRQAWRKTRRSEAEGRLAHQRLADLLDRIGDAFFSFDNEWRCRYANERAAAMSGLQTSEMTGKTFRDLLPGIFTAQRAELLQRAMEQRDFVALDGLAESGIWFELSVYPGTEGPSVFIRDVTARKRGEIAIAKSEEYFRRIFDQSPVGMLIIGMDGKFVRVNNSMCRMIEYSEEELVRMQTVDVTPIEDWDTSGFYSQKQQELITGQIDHLQMEKRYVTKSGKILWTNLNASMLPEGEDRRYFLGVVEDITERKKVAEQLRESQKLESLGVLAGGIAHDFNNLLTGILGNASLCLDLAPANGPVRPLLHRLMQASERAADLTRQLLAYAGKGRFIVSAISLSSVVKEISGLVRANFPENVRLELDLPPQLSAIEADPAQIQQIVMNLLLNAAESVPADREGVVTVRTFELVATEEDLRGALASVRPEPGRYVGLEVRDNGSGMDATTRVRIFEPFFTTKFTGRGLGLSAVLGIVSACKGAVYVDSQVGTGTVFRILLPACAKPADRSVIVSHEQLRGAGTILVVDDEPMILAVARGALELFGYQVLAAASGTEALEILQSRTSVELVLLDVTMPEMSGQETFKRIRSVRPNLPVILCSGHSEEEAAGRFSFEGLAGFLQKPYTASQLAEKIKPVLQPN